MEFENITITDQGVVKLKKITVVIPLHNSMEKQIESTTSNRELIHIAINRQVLLNDFSRNSDFIYERILQILLRSKDISMDDKCLFEDWNYHSIRFKNWEGKKCNSKEKKLFYTNKSDKIFERVNGNKDATWREYMNIVSYDPCMQINAPIKNIMEINKKHDK